MIPVSKPIIFPKAQKFVLDSLKTGWVSGQGPFVQRFEEEFARFLGVKYAVTTTSGTASLHLALAALKIGKGDEVIIPTFTMAAVAFAVVYTGATPVLIDSEPETWNIDINQIEKKITKNTKAIILVHIYGHPVDIDSLLKIAKKYKLYVIEDIAEAVGAEFKGKKVGSFGDVSCTSFYANKTVTCGEGGMVATNNPKIAKRLRLLKDMAYSGKKRFLHLEVGFTYRMGSLQAALGLAQLEGVDLLIKKKRWVADFYNSRLSSLPLTLPQEKPWAKNIYWMYGVLVNRSHISKEALRQKLLSKGIDTRDFFIPMHKQPALKNLGFFKGETYPVAEDLSKRGFYLPSGPNITDKELAMVCEVLKESYGM